MYFRNMSTRALVDSSRRLAYISTKGRIVMGDDPWWVNDHDVVGYRGDGPATGFVLTNVGNGTQEPLTTLTRQFKHTCEGSAPEWIPSPDGRRVIWFCQREPSGDNLFAVATVEGTDVRHWRSKDRDVKWISDGKTWITYDSGDGPISSVTFYEYGSLKHRSVGLANSVDDFDSLMCNACVTAERQLVTVPSNFEGCQPDDALAISGADLRNSGALAQIGRTPSHKDEYLMEGAISPSGQYIVWTGEREYAGARQFLDRLHFPSSRPRVDRETGLFIAKTNGNSCREIDHVDVAHPLGPTTTDYWIHDIRWLPNGKEFVYECGANVYRYSLTREDILVLPN